MSHRVQAMLGSVDAAHHLFGKPQMARDGDPFFYFRCLAKTDIPRTLSNLYAESVLLVQAAFPFRPALEHPMWFYTVLNVRADSIGPCDYSTPFASALRDEMELFAPTVSAKVPNPPFFSPAITVIGHRLRNPSVMQKVSTDVARWAQSGLVMIIRPIDVELPNKYDQAMLALKSLWHVTSVGFWTVTARVGAFLCSFQRRRQLIRRIDTDGEGITTVVMVGSEDSRNTFRTHQAELSIGCGVEVKVTIGKRGENCYHSEFGSTYDKHGQAHCQGCGQF
jgi:hypothetical protein